MLPSCPHAVLFFPVLQFIQPASQPASEPLQLVLVGLPHLSLDPQQSLPGSATFTERWGEYLAGSGPPPAPAPAQHTSFCRAGVQSVSSGGNNTGQCHSQLQLANWQSTSSSGGSSCRQLGIGSNSGLQSLNKRFFPLLLGQQQQQQPLNRSQAWMRQGSPELMSASKVRGV